MSDTSHDASLFCVAHLITLLAEEMADLDGGSGVVSKETIGPRIVEYVTQAMTARGRSLRRPTGGACWRLKGARRKRQWEW